MPTYIIRFLGPSPEAFQGVARHVQSGEEIRFVSEEELLRFFAGINAVCAVTEEGEWADRPDDER